MCLLPRGLCATGPCVCTHLCVAYVLSSAWEPAGITCLAACVSVNEVCLTCLSFLVFSYPQPPVILLHSWLWGLDLMLSDYVVLSVTLGIIQAPASKPIG